MSLLETIKAELDAAGFEATWHTDPFDPCLLTPGGIVIYPDGMTQQYEDIQDNEWPAVLIIARHLAPLHPGALT